MKLPQKRFICIGETVYDILFKEDKPVEGTPGGAMLNTSVSLGRLGENVVLVGDYAKDAIGRLIEKFLVRNQVSLDYIKSYNNGLSRIAIAVLNDNNDAEYSFYKIRKEGQAELIYPEPDKNDLVMFGSFYGIKEEIREGLTAFLHVCRNVGSIVLYDPNFRKNHMKIKDQVMPMISENMRLAHITKGSDEDFNNILGTSDPKIIYDFVQTQGGHVLIMTANKHGVTLCTPQIQKHYPVKDIPVISTIGAGDTFNAGLLYALSHTHISPADLETLPEKNWDKIIRTAIQFAEHVCMSYENYLSWDFAREVANGH
ncbi:MAG: PfkB family carbohydrate kinase [Bacteroidales bacterium]|jgi:fructokinase